MAELGPAPEWALNVLTRDDGEEVIVLEISTQMTRYQVVLADKGNYKTVASKLNEGIRRLGAEVYGTSLITVKEMPDGLRKPPQGR